ncbi:TPA: hypothetical protein N0F65_012485 [Lagenidium giganteum]|uniref:DUF659 domain-containing protein n=1 Tax=Lagenidium giganteum TaxID=4803 RepID=A0AAV2YUZ0_9STRA|nr:TPA: hypothetical protein N0F65_012485 [Lagenidium giganteum]
MVFNLHYIDKDFVSHGWPLEVQEFPGMHTSQLIATTIGDIIQRWCLDKSRCTLLLRDGALNAIAAARIVGVMYSSCIAHSIHLVVGGALIQSKQLQPCLDGMRAVVNIFRGLATKFRRSPKAKHCFERIQVQTGIS